MKTAAPDGWFVYFRLHAPTGRSFDKSWSAARLRAAVIEVRHTEAWEAKNPSDCRGFYWIYCWGTWTRTKNN